MKIKKMYQGTAPENKILNTHSDSQTDVYSCDYINNLKTTIFDGTLKGGESVTLENSKRFLDVYAAINFAAYDGTIKYTIDTKIGNVVFGGSMLTPFDEEAMNTYYVSESKYDKTNGEFTHSRTGYCDIISGSYVDRNANEGYYVYKIDTYN